MKVTLIIGVTALMILANAGLRAADLTNDIVLSYDEPSPARYRSHELSLDAFGGLTLGQETTDQNSGERTRHDARLGAGAGLNYFFTRHLGIAAEGFTENPRHSFVDNADGSMVFRLPLGKSGMAAYLLGGAGHQFDSTSATTFHTGGGLEYRFTEHFGTFIEPRIVFKQGNYGFGRCGVRWSF
jgi:hypothetical protein